MEFHDFPVSLTKWDAVPQSRLQPHPSTAFPLFTHHPYDAIQSGLLTSWLHNALDRIYVSLSNRTKKNPMFYYCAV
jgi:hypothetical protein